MKLHTSLTTQDVHVAFRAVRDRGLMTRDIFFVQFKYENSRSHVHGYLIQLGTYDQTSGPTNSRYYKNSGRQGATSGIWTDRPVWAATYDEWGWFIAELFSRDPGARFGHYKTVDDFHRLTGGKFRDMPRSEAVRAAAVQVARSAELLNDKPADETVFGPWR